MIDNNDGMVTYSKEEIADINTFLTKEEIADINTFLNKVYDAITDYKNNKVL